MTHQVTSDMSLKAFRERLYERYATTHAKRSSARVEALAFQRDIRPHLPADRNVQIVDIGCGQGQLVRQMHLAGYVKATGVDISREQVELARASGITGVVCGDFLEVLRSNVDKLHVVTATDILEHLAKAEVLSALEAVERSLVPGGRLIARVPNSLNPFAAYYRHGDFTHESWFTPGSLRQLAAIAQFDRIDLYMCKPLLDARIGPILSRALWEVTHRLMVASFIAEAGFGERAILTMNVVGVFTKAGPRPHEKVRPSQAENLRESRPELEC